VMSLIHSSIGLLSAIVMVIAFTGFQVLCFLELKMLILLNRSVVVVLSFQIWAILIWL
jgi:hypothetical protein